MNKPLSKEGALIVSRAERCAAWLVSRSSRIKFTVAVSADIAVLSVCAALAVLLTTEPGRTASQDWWLVVFAPPIVASALFATGAYRAVIRFIGAEFIGRSTAALALAAIPLLMFYQPEAAWGSGWQPVAVFTLLAGAGLTALRLSARRLLSAAVAPRRGLRVLIYGAGDGGAQTAAALQMRGQYRPIGFVDDRSSVQGRTILGLPVHTPAHLPKLKAKGAFDQILLAIPSLSRTRRREILESLEPLAVQVLVMPGLEDLASGRKRVDELREVQIEDLLEREAVAPIPSLLDAFIAGKSVMVTGAGGSIGSELCRQAVQQGAQTLVLLEVCEFALYRIDRELRELPASQGCNIVPVLNTVLDAAAITRAMRAYAVQTVYHAAAYKHVPLVEANVIAAVRNNVLGTLNTVQSALQSGVQNFVLISTDKAVRPTNVMGASKRMCELIVQALAPLNPDTRMSMVRFGNVLASSGSVVPLFREQIKQGGPVTVTHPDVTRYFMTIPEAAQLVIQAGAMGQHGEVFLLEMGQPVKIRQLAERMIHLSGLTVKDAASGRGDIEIRYSGLRPGEKLYEELLIGERPVETDHARIFKAQENFVPWQEFDALIGRLTNAVEIDDESVALEVLQSCVSGFARQENKSGGLEVAAKPQELPATTSSAKPVRTKARPSQGLIPLDNGEDGRLTPSSHAA